MADQSPQGGGIVSSTFNTVTPVVEARNIMFDGGAQGLTYTVALWSDLMPDKTIQCDTFTITGMPAGGDVQVLDVTDEDGNVGKYTNTVDAADSFEKMVEDFVSLINTDDDLIAVVSAIDPVAYTATVEMKSAMGKSYVAVASSTGTTVVGPITSVAAGDPAADLLRRKLANIKITYTVKDDGVHNLRTVYEFLDGDSLETINNVVDQGAINLPLTLNQLQNNA